MNFGDMVEIKDISGKTRFSTPINNGAKGKFTLMKEDYIILPFSVPSPIPFKLGDYADLTGILDESLGGKLAKVYEITDLQKPTYNTSTGGYDYQLRLDAYYWKWKNKIFKYTPEKAGNEASWSLTASLDVHLGVVLRNLKALGYTYKGTEFTFSIDSTVEDKAVAVTYDNINILDALFTLASKEYYNCDCWITDNVIHFGRNEFGDAVKIERGVEASSVTRSESQGTYATRIFAFGSTKNIPTNYRPTDEQAVVNGVVQKRLMLPIETPYIDAYEGMSEEEAIEDVVIFDDVFPRRVGELSDVHTRTEEVENEDGSKETVTYYRYKDTGLEFKEEYIIEGQELKIQFQSGKLNGMEFGVIFNPEPKDESRGMQLWEIVRNENYGRMLPDEIMFPANGDKYILSGFDIQLVSDLYIPEAEQELKEKALKYAQIAMKDDGTYPTTLRSSWVKEDLISRTFEFGQCINLVDDTYFENGRISRVLGWELKLDIPWDSPVYTIGESMPYSRIQEIEDKVDALTYKGQTYTGGGGSGVYIIRTNDSTPPSDSNVFSALRSISMFLRKDKADSTNFLIKFLGGLISDNIESQDFAAGPFGTGFIIKRNPKTGKSYIETDELYVRLKAYFDTLEIKHLSHVGGRIVLSPASMECNKVELIGGTVEPLYDSLNSRLEDITNSELYAKVFSKSVKSNQVYRCYFNNTDGEKDIVNEFAIDDLAQCREFNVKTNVSHNVQNQYYWRRVVGVGDNYIDLSIDDCDAGSMIPKTGDTIVTIGNATDTNRQHVVFLSSYDDDAPCIKLYSGINSYSMLNKEVTVISPNADKNVFTGKVIIKPGSEGFGNFVDGIDTDKIDQAISDAVKTAQDAQQSANKAEGAVNDLNNYVDGAFADGIIEQSEAQAIEKYINQVESTKEEVLATYNALYTNTYLTGTAKSNLLNAKVSFVGNIDNLIASINSAIADGKATTSEKNDVDAKFSAFSSSYADLSRAIEEANKAIQDKIKELAASEAVEKVESQIQAVTDEAKDDLAKQMGYINGYSDMVKAAEQGETVIAGGRLNTNLIEADAIVTTALIASAIKSKTLNVNDNFIVDTQGNVNIAGNSVIEGNAVFRGAIETTFVNISESDAIYGGVSGNYGIYRLNKQLNIIASLDIVELPIDMSYTSKRVTIVNGETIYTRTAQSTRIRAASSMGLYGLPIADNERDGEVYVSELSLLTGVVELVAIPVSGKSFVRWFVTNISAAYFSTVIKSGAAPDPTQYTVSTSVNPSGAGTVTGGGTQIKGYVGQLTATPNRGYVFSRWSTGSTDNPTSVTWDRNKSIIANFVEGITDPAVLTINVSPEGSGTVTGAGTYEKGTKVTMKATPNSGYYFSRWSDGDTDISKSYQLNEDKTFTAYFAKDEAPTGENILVYNDNKYYSVLEDTSGEVKFYYFIYPVITVYPSFNGCAVALDKGYLSGKIKAGKRYNLQFRIGIGKGANDGGYQYGCISYIGRLNDSGMDSISSDSEAMFTIEDEFDVAQLHSMTFMAERTSTSEDAFVVAITKIDTITAESARIYIKDLFLKEI